MPKRRLYCPLANIYCKHSAKKGENSICRLTERPLSEYKECIRDAIYKEKHKVEIWFSKEGWQMGHLLMIGTYFEKGDLRLIIDYNGIAIQKRHPKVIRIKNPDELKSLLPPEFPDWLITELSKKIRNNNNSCNKKGQL